MTKEESTSVCISSSCCTVWHIVGPHSEFVEGREAISYPFM